MVNIEPIKVKPDCLDGNNIIFTSEIRNFIRNGNLEALKYQHINCSNNINYSSYFRPINFAILAEQPRIVDYYCQETSIVKSNEDLVDCNRRSLEKHPVVNYCLNPTNKLSLISPILQNSYSKEPIYTTFISSLAEIINRSPTMIKDLLIFFAAASTHAKINIQVIKNMKEHIPTLKQGLMQGLRTYSGEEQKTYITLLNEEDVYTFLLHEITHYSLSILFNQVYPNPYHYNDEIRKNLFSQAVRKTFVNIQDHLKNAYNYNITISEEESNFAIAEKINHLIEGFGYPTFFDFHYRSLNLSDKLSKLGTNSIQVGVGFGDLGLIKLSLLNNEPLDGNFLLEVIAQNNETNLFNWILENDINFDINYINIEGKTAIDYTSDPNLIKLMIQAGAKVYPSIYKDTCEHIIMPNIDDVANKIREEIPLDLKSIRQILSFAYGYDESQQDSEFIAFVIQTLSSKKYFNPNIVEIIQPIIEYWDESIKPAIYEYHQNNSLINPYLPLLKLYDVNEDLNIIENYHIAKQAIYS